MSGTDKVLASYLDHKQVYSTWHMCNLTSYRTKLFTPDTYHVLIFMIIKFSIELMNGDLKRALVSL